MATTPHKAGADKLDLLAGLSLDIRNMSPAALAALGRKARTHPKAQIQQIADSIRTFGFAVPVLVDEQDKVIAGNARVEAAVQLGLATVPVVTLSHLSAGQKRAFVLAENKLASLAGWDKTVLGLEFEELRAIDLDFDLEITGFAEPEIDALIFSNNDDGAGDAVPAMPLLPTSRVGDLWLLGQHRVLCGDSTGAQSLEGLLAGDKARTVFTDPPYNCSIRNHVTGSGIHGEFVQASGEMSDVEFMQFLAKMFARLEEVLMPGGLAYVCMDFRNMRNLLEAADTTDLKLLNLIVWDKGSGAQGGFYRSRHELIFLFAAGGAQHLNRVQLGRHGRDRHNVWTYPGVKGFGAEKAREREMHPTVKNFALVRDALLDSTAHGDLVVDLFSGSGTTLVAAHASGRRAAVMDLDPIYVDTTIVRWQDFSGEEARLAATGQTFREVRSERAARQVVTAESPPPARVRTRLAA